MSWLFSQALVEDCSGALSLDGERCAQLNVMPTAHSFWRRGKTIDACSHSLFGLTSAVLTEDRGRELLMSFLAGFHAKTSAPLERGPALKANAPASGAKWRESFVKYDPATSSWRTVQLSLVEGLDEFSETWPRSGSMRDGACSLLPMSDSHTSESACGSSLPTPSGVNGGRNNTMGRVDEWGGSSNPLRGTVIGSMCLPEFEELVMGWPIGWTELTPFGTAKFREWQSEHGAL